MAFLELKNIIKEFGPVRTIKGVDLAIDKGEFIVFVGPSGCGKSTLLRSVNRMNDLIDSVRIEGEMRLNGDSIYAAGQDVIELRLCMRRQVLAITLDRRRQKSGCPRSQRNKGLLHRRCQKGCFFSGIGLECNRNAIWHTKLRLSHLTVFFSCFL